MAEAAAAEQRPSAADCASCEVQIRVKVVRAAARECTN
jgi:hypothetical protein